MRKLLALSVSVVLFSLAIAPSVDAQSGRIFIDGLRYNVSSQTCASNGGGTASSVTVTVLLSYVALTQNDADGCAITLSETGARDGALLTIVNISSNSATIADSSGVQELYGGTTITLAQYSSAAFIYRSDRWVAVSSSASAAGNVVGPASSTDEAVARFDSTTGLLLQNTSTLTLSDAGVFSFADGVKQTFNPNGTNAGINVGSQAGDPSTPANGDLWYDSTANELTARINGSTVSLGAGAGDVVGPGSATDEAVARFDLTTGKLIQNTSTLTLSDAGAFAFADGVKQTFNPNGTNAGINVGSQAGDPGSPANGDLWYDSTANELTARINGSNIALSTGGGTGYATVQDEAGSLTQRLILNFTGSGVSCVDNSGSSRTDCTVSGGAGGTFPGSSTDEALVRFDGAGGSTVQNSTITLSDGGALTFPDGVKQTFNPDGTTAGINVGSQAGDPGTPANGDLWYDSTANELTARINGASVALGAGGGTPAGSSGDIQYNNAGAFGGAGISDCDNTTTSKLLYDTATKTFSCGTDQTGGGSGAWSLRFTALSGISPASNAGTFSVRNATPIIQFDTTTQESTYFLSVLPADYASGGVTVCAHWAAASATTGTIGWDVSFERIGDGSQDLDSDGFGSATTITATTVPGTSGLVGITCANVSDGSSMDSTTAGESFRLRIRRDVSNDTATGDADLVAVDVKEQ
jgi:hypothetical protein